MVGECDDSWLNDPRPASQVEAADVQRALDDAAHAQGVAQGAVGAAGNGLLRLEGRHRELQPRDPGDKWHLDEVFVKINGTTHYLWRAVHQHGDVLDILVQSRRNAVAANRFFRKLLKGLRYVPRVLVTNKLASYQVAHREVLPSVTHRRSKYLNNRAENSHQPTRIRERAMKRFASPGQAQRFLFAFSHIRQHFRPRRHLISAPQWRTEMTNRFAVWDEITVAAAA